MSNPVLEAIRTRRVVRALTDQPVEREKLVEVLKAARWAPSGGNRRLHRFVAVQNPLTLRLLRMVSPGMIQRPTAVILICTDWQRMEAYGIPRSRPPTRDSGRAWEPGSRGSPVDVGTAAATMLLAAHALGLGSGIVTSFSKAAVSTVLNLPEHLTPEMFITLGYAAPGGPPPMRSWGKLTWQSLVDWERFPSS